MSYPNSCVSHTSYASYASPLYLNPWHQIVSGLSDQENMLSDFGSAETENFPTDDDAETEVFPSDQEEPDSTTNNHPLLGNVPYQTQVLVYKEIYKKVICLVSSNVTGPHFFHLFMNHCEYNCTVF